MECEFLQYCRANPDIYAFTQHRKGKITENNVLESEVNEDLFRKAEVDIEVRKQWYFQDLRMTPFGKHMQDHAVKFNLF